MPNWTEAQLQAIHTRGQNVLVSAAAGSGKTAVLSARVGEFVENGGRLDRLLIVTFTNAAAAEMRSRIAKDLARRAASNPQDLHLRRQSLTLYKAKICTIDSYGMDLLRRNFQSAGISPDFTVLDETELSVIQSAVLQRQIEEYYRDLPQGFGDFLSLFGGETHSHAMETAIVTVARSMETFPFADHWLDRQKARLSGSEEWCAGICEILRPVFEEYLDVFTQVINAAPFPEKGMAVVQEETALLREIVTALTQGNWDEVCRKVKGHLFTTAPQVRKGYPKEAFLYKEYRSLLKDFLQKEEVFYLPSSLCEEDLATLRPGMEFLFDAVRDFRKGIMEEMHRRSAYSFSALAEMALTLVVQEYSHKTGEFTPTALAQKEQEAYDEVLIDEYQDVNNLQDLFFRAVTCDNCFAVGDVKQSIYGFRGANAGNFLRKKETCKVIALNKNFRSRKGILDLVNFLCRGLFSPLLGGLEYDEGETLFPGRGEDEANPYPPNYGQTLPAGEDAFPSPSQTDPREPHAELLLIPTAGRSNASHYAEEARLCAKLIRDAVEGGATVYDKNEGVHRPMRYSDIAILLRYFNTAPLYEEAFRAWGIPLLSSDGETFLDTPEVCGIMAFLRTVNDPWDDVSLFVTLTGNIFSFSPQTVAEFRLCAKNKPLWEGVKCAAKEQPSAENAIKILSHFRILAENLPIPKLIWEIYTATDYLALESAAAPSARSNLMKFYAFARRYSRSDGLFGFLEFCDRARASGKVRESGAAPDGDFVRITTIHKSKGLEYAWCILPELEKNFRADTDKVRIDSTYGIAPKVRNEEQTAEYTTLMRELIGFRANRADISEELRVLYVALTRARDRLTLISRCTDKIEALETHGLHSKDGAVRLIDRLNTNNYRTLILDRAVAHPHAEALRSPFLPPEESPCEGLRVSFVGIPEEILPVKQQETPQCRLSAEELHRRFSFRYDKHLSAVPAKVSVTEIAKAPADPDSALLIQQAPVSRPKFLDRETLSAAEEGTAFHTYCQFADFEKPVPEEIARLVKAGHLTEAAAAAINTNILETFLQSRLMETLRGAIQYQREVRFVCRIPVSYYSGNPGEEGEMLMQGAMDLLCELEDGYLIVDFKSDRAGEEELLSRYSRQLNLYAAAVRRLYDKPVIGCKIWAFRLGKAIDVKEEEL